MQNMGGRRRNIESEASRASRRSFSAPDTSKQFRVGRTLSGEARSHRHEIELEHIEERKQRKKQNILSIVTVCIFMFVIIAIITLYVMSLHKTEEEVMVDDSDNFPTTPTVTIVDENAGSLVSTRVQTFIARLEVDAKDYGYTIDHVVLPYQKSREIWVFVTDRSEYYKVTIDRGSTVQAEDISRMIKYLQSHEIYPEYVDLRVEGKSYYK